MVPPAQKYQKSIELLIRKGPFHRLVRCITNTYNSEMRWQAYAVEALQ